MNNTWGKPFQWLMAAIIIAVLLVLASPSKAQACEGTTVIELHLAAKQVEREGKAGQVWYGTVDVDDSRAYMILSEREPFALIAPIDAVGCVITMFTLPADEAALKFLGKTRNELFASGD